MGSMLFDGTVVPHHLGLRDESVVDESGDFTNNSVRMGEVTDVVYADDERSYSKKVTEYTVAVQHFDQERGTWVARPYSRCVLSTTFGGIADHVHYTLRKDKQDKEGIGKGSKVLLACLNGERAQPVIIGGYPDQGDASGEGDKRRKLGHHYDWVFNGIQFFVNKDGELVIKYNGKTGVDGKVDSSVTKDQAGTRMAFAKDGTWAVVAGDQEILIDRPKKDIHLRAKNKIFTDSAGVELGRADQKMMLGTAFRNEQEDMHLEMTQAFQIIGQGFIQVAAFLQAAAAALSANSPTAAGPQVLQASATMFNLTKEFTRLGKAINKFEGRANQYLSTRNFLD